MGSVIKQFSRNDEMQQRLALYEFYEYSYEGGEEYKNNGYLIKHERESQDSYNRRIKESVLVNICAQVIDLYNAHLYRTPPIRDYAGLDSNVAFDSFLNDADFMGNPYADIVKAISERGSVYGIYGIIVDKPNMTANSLADEIANDIRPYIALYEPECIWDWKYERVNGGRPKLTSLTLEDDGMVKVWSPESVQTWGKVAGTKNDYEFIEEVPNRIGVIPFVLHKNRASLEQMESVSDISDLAFIQQSIYQLDSQAHEIINRTAFPVMEIPESSIPMGDKQIGTGTAADVVIGTGNALVRQSGDSIGHRYIEPAHSSLPLILQWREALLQDFAKVARIAHASAVRGSAMSGVALEIEFQQLNALLADRGDAMERTEMQILNYVARWIGQSFAGSVEYPDNFGVRDLANDIQTAVSANALIPSTTFKQEQAVGIAKRILPEDTPTEVFDKIVSELDSTKQGLSLATLNEVNKPPQQQGE